MKKIISTGIAGYGLSGRVFHAPFLDAHPGFSLKTIFTSGEEAATHHPEAKIARGYDELLDDKNLDLIVIATPNEFHFDQAKQALLAGKDVILEKPITPTAREARELFDLAAKSGRHLFPYQNRRWDGDFLTLRHIMEEGYLGEVLDFESRFDRYNPEVGRASWRYSQALAGGTLYDLGIHLADQAVALFGAPEAVFCRLFNQRENSLTDDSFDLKLIYPGVNVTLKAGVFVREQGPRFALHGRLGSFVKYGLDPQEAALKKGIAPCGPDWGKEPKRQWGLLHTEFNGKKIHARYETLAGNYAGLLDNVYEVALKGVAPAIRPEEALVSLRIIELAKESGEKQSVIPFNL